MADNNGNNDDVFVYMGGDQEVPRDVTHVRVHKSVKIIRARAFRNCRNLVSVEMHDGVEIIEEAAFYFCSSLRGIKLPGVRVIENNAFFVCALEDVEFGDKLETIGDDAFRGCRLRNIKLPKCRVIGEYSFANCRQLTDVELSDEDLETIGYRAFSNCRRLRRIAIPLKDNLFDADDTVFDGCEELSQVDLHGGIHKTISSLLLDSWRNEMNDTIDRINQVLPDTPHINKTAVIRNWLKTVSPRIEPYKLEHYPLLKENMSLLELALWKTKLQENGYDKISFGSDLFSTLWKDMTPVELACWKTRFDEEFVAPRQETRATCGANIIIPHVLSFLNDDDIFPLLHYDHQP